MKRRNLFDALAEMIQGEEHSPKPRPKKSASFTKKGPGRVHAGSVQKRVRSYRKHYEAKPQNRSQS